MSLAPSSRAQGQGEGMPTGYYKAGLLLLLLGTLEAIAAPLITASTLVASARLFDVELTQPYVLLAVLAALLSYPPVRQASLPQGLLVSGWCAGTRRTLPCIA